MPTGKKKSQVNKELTSSLKRLSDAESIINRGPVIYCIWRLNQDAPIEYVSGNISQWGYEPDDFATSRLTWRDIVHPDDYERLKSEILDHLKQKTKVFNQEYRILDSRGEIHWVEDQTVCIADHEGKITHAQGSIMDVTDKYQAQDARRKTQKIYQTIFENTGTGLAISDIHRNILMVNEKMEEITGFKREEIFGEKGRWEYYIDPADLERLTGYHLLRLTDPASAPGHYECRIKTKSGEMKNVIVTSELIPDTRHSLVSMLDISDLKKAEARIQQSEQRLQELLAKSSDVIVVLDENGVMQYVSPSIRAVLQYDQEALIGRRAIELVHPDDLTIAGKALQEVIARKNKGIATEFRFRRADGHWIYLEGLGNNCMDNPAIGGIIITVRDISERKRLETQLLHSQKMEAIGRLAGGIAHDFNNILMGIQGYISLLLLKIDTIHPDFEKMINIQTLVQSGADLTGKLLGFARGGRFELKATDINTLIAKTVNLFGRTKKDIAVHQKYEESLWTAEVDRVQIEQVILNLFVNAWQAMPQGGDMFVQTENVTLARQDRVKNIKAGRYVKISVSDTGVGMDEETRRQIFEPFFTTKQKGRGIGLGLASAYGIIRDHKGGIDVTSASGQGTKFDLYLPASDKPVPKEAFASRTIFKGTETILLIDDEDAILDVCKDILISLGYKIHTAPGGACAAEIYAGHAHEIDLIILDMIMPGMSGTQTFEELRRINPKARIILSTGYSGTEQARQLMKNGCQGLIQKPFRIEELSRKIREVLDR
ncbi:MAG: PAS domain S-box protein [Smithellaceae bacterium]